MEYLVTGKEMKFLDKNTSEHFHVPELVLMEQAAMTFVQKLFELNIKYQKVYIVAGSGNNGADGLAIARLLKIKGIDVSVFLTEQIAESKNQTKSYQLQKDICKRYGA